MKTTIARIYSYLSEAKTKQTPTQISKILGISRLNVVAELNKLQINSPSYYAKIANKIKHD